MAISLGGCWTSLKLRIVARFAEKVFELPEEPGAILGTLVCIRYVLIRRLLAVRQIKEIMVLLDREICFSSFLGILIGFCLYLRNSFVSV